MDSFLTDALLETVSRWDIYVAIRSDGAAGSGTQEDPYDGSTAARFDEVMRNKVSGNTTVHLGPTPSGHPFLTNGCNLSDTGHGWKPKSGQRIIGAGQTVTTLKLADDSSFAGSRVAVGNQMDSSSDDYLDGFELSDLTIDCNLSKVGDQGQGTTASTGGVALTGRHLLVQRVRVIQFGARSTTWPCSAIALGRPRASNPLPPLDCVISDCRVDSRSSAHAGAVNCLELSGSVIALVPAWHETSMIRHCVVDGTAADTSTPDLAKEVRGIYACGGVGTIVERNRIANCRYGGPFELEPESAWVDAFRTRDLVVRENIYFNVLYGVSLEVRRSGFNRVVIDRNWFELALDTTAVGIRLHCLDNDEFAGSQLVVRRNRLLHNNGSSVGNGPVGLSVQWVQDAVLERNVIQLGSATSPILDNAVRTENCSRVTCFNNQIVPGLFVPGWNVLTQRHHSEFTTDVQDAALAL